jgi:hypothetical protein
MSKKFKYTMKSFGIYESFDKDSKGLPRFLERTMKIPCRENIEFGYILHITGGKGKKLTFEIDHPPFNNSKGEIAPPFTGEIFINSNDYKFYLGDRVWLPLEDKQGPWRLRTFCDKKTIADKTLTILPQ